MQPPVLSAEELTRLLTESFPETFRAGSGFTIEAVWHGGARVRRAFNTATLRPGGTISGPAMMGLTDVTMYVTVLAAIGWKPLAVTTQLGINFLRKPPPDDLVAEGRLLKLGKRLAVLEVSICSGDSMEPVAHATGTYSIP